MVNNYEVPMAKVICFETINIIATSTGLGTDTPDTLKTWGKSISEYASADFDLFK